VVAWRLVRMNGALGSAAKLTHAAGVNSANRMTGAMWSGPLCIFVAGPRTRDELRRIRLFAGVGPGPESSGRRGSRNSFLEVEER